ncbi:Sporulation related domain-containing protein [Amphritea atlantica]|uniref:Sporulation related domain-containing protein n=1 Tax=Amphritea atlantica TaxID=355243 RepID=A0A1H9EUA4_9GAMM|nr:AAA family ATPase [Amphritea atlantica]SEQ28803.1 Sporulation related domain-containing protein [Amphritea atlantica]
MADLKGNGVDALADAFASAEQRKSFFFEPSSRLQLLEKLEHLSRFSDFLLLVTGPEGAGKTTLIRQLQGAESDRTLRLCSLDGSKTPGLNGVLVALSEQLSPELDTQADNQQMLNAIYRFAQVMAVEHIQWVIIIDNADQLENQVVQLLLQMLSEAQGLPVKPHLLMAAGDSFHGRLQGFDEYELLESQVHQLILEPFTATEAKSYLLQRYSAAASLTEKQLEAVYEASGGYPGSLNQQAELLFRSGSVKKTAKSAGFSRVHLVSVAAVLLLVLLGGLWQYWPESDAGTTRTQVQIQVPIEAGPVIAANESPVAEVKVNQTDTDNNQSSASDSLPLLAQSNSREEISSVLQTADRDTVETAETSAPSGEPVAADRMSESVNTGQPLAKTPDTRVSEAKPADKPVVAVADKPVVAPIAPAAKKVKVIEPEPVVKKAPVKAAVAGNNQLTEAEQTLMGWPASGYTLQMLGAGMRKSAEAFIREQAEPQKFYMFQTRYKGNPWFVVVYGQYKDRDAAHAASASLPSALARLKPWARTIQGIQADLAARK